MQSWAESFYKSETWKRTRKAYASSVGGLCERCKAKGIYTPGDTVHHIEHLTIDNINDPNITLAWDNLMLVCRNCHAEIHSKPKRRYMIDENGSVIFP